MLGTAAKKLRQLGTPYAKDLAYDCDDPTPPALLAYRRRLVNSLRIHRPAP
jgi:hypothetical protein